MLFSPLVPSTYLPSRQVAWTRVVLNDLQLRQSTVKMLCTSQRQNNANRIVYFGISLAVGEK